MKTIYLNDKSQQTKAQTLQEFLDKHRSNLEFAIAINHQFIPRSAYSTSFLSEGDRVDMIVPMQGG